MTTHRTTSTSSPPFPPPPPPTFPEADQSPLHPVLHSVAERVWTNPDVQHKLNQYAIFANSVLDTIPDSSPAVKLLVRKLQNLKPVLQEIVNQVLDVASHSADKAGSIVARFLFAAATDIVPPLSELSNVAIQGGQLASVCIQFWQQTVDILSEVMKNIRLETDAMQQQQPSSFSSLSRGMLSQKQQATQRHQGGTRTKRNHGFRSRSRPRFRPRSKPRPERGTFRHRVRPRRNATLTHKPPPCSSCHWL